MLKRLSIYAILVLGFASLFAVGPVNAQTGNSSSIEGVVKDPSGGVVAGATVEIAYSVSGFQRQTTTGSDGGFKFTNVPFNTYHTVVSAPGFATYTQDVDVRSGVPVSLQVSLKLGTAETSVTVTEKGADLVETESTFHTDVDRGLIDKLPLESASSSLTSLVTLVSPGVAADSNGNMHGLGDHAQNSFSVDGQPITDQTSKVFSNQLSSEAVQSMEVISGAPPAEFGDKTSLVIKVTTKSGLGVTKPTGSVTASYGSFGTSNTAFNLAYGGQNWGNFIAVNGLQSGRFLDGPEFSVFHDKGNQENLFDRVDYNLSHADSLHLNASYTRSWFQTPNTFDNLNVLDPSANSRQYGSALQDWNVQYRADVDEAHQHFSGVYSGRVRTAGPVQLLSERQSVCRFWTNQFRDYLPGSQAYERGRAVRYLLREGHSQREGGRDVPAHFPFGK